MSSGVGLIDGMFWVIGGMACFFMGCVILYAVLCASWYLWKASWEARRQGEAFKKALKDVPMFPPSHANCRCEPLLTKEAIQKNRQIAETVSRAMQEAWSEEKLRQAIEEIMGVPVTGTIMGIPVVESESLREWEEEIGREEAEENAKRYRQSMAELKEAEIRDNEEWMEEDRRLGRLLFDLEVDGRAILKKERNNGE